MDEDYRGCNIHGARAENGMFSGNNSLAVLL
jgi:hypothetical protein